ncbi:hypothetical protein THAOC_35509, partial [Thalassiosira oceanica]
VNEVLKDKMLVEVRHSLEQVRKKLKMQNRTPIDAAAAFAGALPFELLHIMKKWLMDTDSAEGREVTFDDMVEFLRCEIVLRLFGVSSSELSAFDMAAARSVTITKCWDSFHNDVVPKLSPCLARNYATAMQTRSSETCAIVTSRNTPPRSSRSRPLSMNRAASGTSPAKRKRVSNATDQSNSSSSPRKRSRLQGSPVRRILDRNRKERRSMRINSAAATVGADDDTPALRGGKKRKPKAKPNAPKKLKRKRSRK